MQAVEEFPDDLIIDPSLIVTPKYTEIAETVEQNYRTIHFHVPRSFYDVLEEYDRFSEDEKLPPQIRFFNSYVDMPSLAEVNARFQQLDVGRFSAERYFEEYNIVYDALNESLPYARDRQQMEGRYSVDGDPLTDILFEEYVFLQERSGLVSRLKKTINNFIDAGISIIETSEEVFDSFCEKRLKDSDQRRKAIAKSAGKWVVVSMAGITGNAIGGIPGAVLTAGATEKVINASFLLVFDP